MPDASRLALVILLASVATLGGAFAFEYLGGLPPCVLCIYQRYPYGLAIAVSLAAVAVGEGSRWQAPLFAACGAIFVVGSGLGIYHVGVEQQWWPGTSACGVTFGTATSVEDLRARLLATPVVRCDEVAWSLFGISLAGYNALISAGLGGLSALALTRSSWARGSAVS